MHIIYIAGFKPTVGTTTDRVTVRVDTDVDTDPEYVKSLSDGLVKACYGTYQSHAIRYRRIKLQSHSEVSIYSKAPISLSQIKSPGVTGSGSSFQGDPCSFR